MNKQPAVTTEPIARVRFGRAEISAVVGDLLEQEVEGVVLAANCRGLIGGMAGGGVGRIRSLGGSAIERTLMAQAPLALGSAVVTDAAGLVAEPVRIMIHAVVHPTLGTPALLDAVRRAAPAVIAAAESERLRTLALPVLGVDATTAGGEEERYITTLVDEIVGCLRRAERRFDRIVIVCRYQDQQAAVATALNRARERAWTQTG